MIKLTPRKIKGNTIPSLQPDSEEIRNLIRSGTVSANFPLTTAAARTGSVAVIVPETTNAAGNENPGSKNHINKAMINQPMAIVGNRTINTEIPWFNMYFFGNSTALMKI
ncbi:hypothetical protein WICPIJ_000481 [Wickerhamomyces pijperi]|uniref:Uncharacterized protein n=1 Tax=Wickerhamomyces pijperi TaxID=599730 RepID=A0A9P8TRR7_WICPI|nr:hypothetical protein WICPIJ_000481 [Wickerhamomyces pijperi]